MSNRRIIPVVGLAWGLYGCGAVAPGEAGEPVASTGQAVTLAATGATSAAPESGTLLPVSAARAGNIPPPIGPGFGTPIVNVPGITNTTAFFPPDTVGDVGTNHYIQGVNQAPSTSGGFGSLFTIYDKAGAPVSPEVTNVPLSELVATENECSTAAGDIMVNYDRDADRWLLLQFAVRSAGNHLCIYVSGEEPEALDQWQLYHFDLSTLVDAGGNPSRNGFPDYPKIAVWPDAYYITTNDQVGPGDQDAAVYAVEREAMLAGTTARMQRFALPQDMTLIFQPALPADWDSALPPPDGAPGIVIRRVDEEVNRPGTGTATADQLELWDVNVDFDDQTNSSLEGPTVIATEDFDIDVCGGWYCVTQPEAAPPLETLSLNVMMWRLQYRNFGDRETLVGNFDVDGDGAGTVAPHWYELERSGGGGFALVQEDTLSIDDNHRWMGSIAMDGNGNMALGYSISSTTVYPGIRYIGRRATDPLGSMTVPEATIVDGIGVQTGAVLGGGGRWGDYSAMTVDPVDDCTFWFTTEWFPVTSSVTWFTQIASFRFPECTTAGAPVCVLGEHNVDLRDRVTVTAETAAGNFLELGAPATLNGDGRSGGNALIRSNGVVNGDLTLGGTLSTQGAFTITGTLTQNASPSIPTLTTKTFPTGTGFQVITSNVTLAPGNRGNVVIQSGRTVTLNAGIYNFLSLNVETDVNLVVNGTVEINVQGDFQFGDRSDVIGGTGLTLYSNGSLVRIGTDATFTGVLSAPNASVTVSSRTDIFGCVGGEDVLFDTDVILDGSGRTLPTGTPAAPTCSDGIQNGGETGVDCGGPCPACPAGTISAVAAIPSDWGAGYCAELRVTNTSTIPTTNWSLGVNLNGSIITQTWNGNFSANSGAITVTPGFDWNRVIPAGQTNNSVGFCANRPPGAGTAVVTSATGSF